MTIIHNKALKLTVAIVVLLLALSFLWYWHVYHREHLTYRAKDSRTGLILSSFCKYGGYSFRTYVRAQYSNGNVDIQVNEIPQSADMLSECTQEPKYLVKQISMDPDFKNLTVVFQSDRREVLKLPLRLKGLDLPFANPDPWAK